MIKTGDTPQNVPRCQGAVTGQCTTVQTHRHQLTTCNNGDSLTIQPHHHSIQSDVHHPTLLIPTTDAVK